MHTLPLAAIVFAAAAFGQSEPPAPSFDAADVHPSPRGVHESPLYLHANRLELHGITMLHLITTAYDIGEDKIFGGPNWLDTARYDVIAKGQKVNMGNYRPMLQALLAERFGLKLNTEDKPEPVFALTPAKRVLLKESSGEGAPECKRANDQGYMTMTCTHVTIAYLAEALPRSAPNYFNHPVIDKTGLTAPYDLTLKWTGRGQIGAGDADHPSISLFDYFEKQLGIKVEQQTRSASSLAIHSVNQIPTPNPPGTLEKLPHPLTEFEVAEVRASKPDAQEDFRMQNGRIEAFAVTMRDLIGFAYNLDDYMLPGAEKWMETDRFDIIAKTDPSVTEGALQAMLQNLLVERFGIKSHFEEQPVNVWALTAEKGKVKLKESTGEEHAGCKRTPRDGAFSYSCRNTTMEQLVNSMPSVGGMAGYFRQQPVVDLTGLPGSYDFDIVWSPPARVYGRGGRGDSEPPSAMPTATAPTGGLTIFEALEKQLGLKLVTRKHPLPVVVIDHIDRTPK